MDRQLDDQHVEGEIGLVIECQAGQSRALDVLSGAMALVQAIDALDKALLSSIDTELEPVSILNDVQAVDVSVAQTVVNQGREFLKVRYPDMLGNAQWTVMRSGRVTRVDVLHQSWLDAYHRREFSILPGDSLDCSFEERVGYDAQQNEVERRISVVEVFAVKSPPVQTSLLVQT